jgi:5-formyltetrahydrofolate cyclo-ligase
MIKEILRKQVLSKRESMTLEEAERRSKIIIEKLKEDKDYMKAKTVMFYVSKGREVMTHEIIKEAMKEKKVIAPKVASRGLLCCELSDFSKMNFSCYGVLEPTNEILCDLKDIDLIIVPGTSFDRNGHRIGYGKGYYDGLLKSIKAKKIGLAYDFQIIEKIPIDEWDVKVDKVITD